MMMLKRHETVTIDRAMMLSARGLQALTGRDEYRVTVRARDEEFERRVAKVVDPVTMANLWADTITGTLYREYGNGLTSAISFTGSPIKTGRAIPNRRTRNAEAVSADVEEFMEAA